MAKDPVPSDYLDGYINTIIAFLCLQIVAIAGRVWVRAGIVKAFGWDDVAAIFTLLLASAYDCCIISLYALAGGAVPLLKIRGRYILTVVNLVLSTELLYIAGTTMLKVSLGLLLLRVLVKRWMKWTIWSVMGITIIFGVIYFFIVLFQCGNPKGFGKKIILGQCLSHATIEGTSYVHAVLTALADVVYAILPVVFLWNADFSRRAKISVGGILMLGSVACICTFIRIGWIHYLVLPTGAYIVTARGIAVLSGVELSIGLICISLATYKPLFKCFYDRTRCYYGSHYGNDTEGRSHTRRSFQSQHGAPEQLGDLEQLPPRHPLHSAHLSSHSDPREGSEKTWVSQDAWR